MNQTTPDKFWKRVSVTNENECWPWNGKRTNQGYGMVGFEGKTQPAHRIAYIFYFGDFDRSLDILHKCDNPPCCNPNHLFLGTARDNIKDAIAKGRWKPFQREKHPRALLTENQVAEIRSRWKPGYGNAARLAREFKVTKSCVWGILTNRNWPV